MIQGGKWVKFHHYTVCYKPAESRKFAFSASKKAKTKVLKNRVKRLLKEAVRLNLNLIPRAHYLIIGNTTILNLRFEELCENLIKDLENLSSEFQTCSSLS
ncbi:MAG: ribonuclease P protein component [Candidatus Hydrothermia bacterium]